MYNYILNNLIPADNLYWDDEEKRYVSLSKEQSYEIIEACVQHGINDLQDVCKVVSWCGNIRIAEILKQGFLAGNVEIVGFDENDEPLFKPSKEVENEN